MSYQPSEIADLILLMALGPVIVVSLRNIYGHAPTWLVVAAIGMLVSYTATVAEGLVAHDAFNLVEHVGLAVVGVGLLIRMLQLRRSSKSSSERSR